MPSRRGSRIHTFTLQVGELVIQLSCADALTWRRLVDRYWAFRADVVTSPHLVAEVVVEHSSSPRSAQEPDLSFKAGRLVLEAPGVSGWIEADKGRGHLTLNHSGSGKTTVAGFARPGDLLLNDDLVVLSSHDDRWTAWATPFSSLPGAFNLGPCAAPVAALFRLVQSPSVFAEPLHPAQAVAELVSSAPVVSADPTRSAALLDRCTMLARQVPLYALHFRRDASFWKVVDQVTRK